MGQAGRGTFTLRLTSDINAIKKLLIGSVQTFATYLLTFASLIITMLWMDWRVDTYCVSCRAASLRHVLPFLQEG